MELWRRGNEYTADNAPAFGRGRPDAKDTPHIMNDIDHAATRSKLTALQTNLGRVIQGKPEALERVTLALAAGGSILMEDVPGVGKTMLAKALALSVDATFHRIQFTPDLLPADILGTSIYNPRDGSFAFRRGPIFCNVLLADEINRASPRTQSALLEAMSEGQATIEGERHVLPEAFMVIATQNPVEYHGTYPLPEAQLDRFLMQIHLGYPAAEAEARMLFAQSERHPIDDLETVLSLQDVLHIHAAVRSVFVEESIGAYLVALVNQTRMDGRLRLGVSPRGTLMLFRAAQASAFMAGRRHVLPDDVQRLAGPVLAHRLILTSKSKYAGVTKAAVIADALKEVRVPA